MSSTTEGPNGHSLAFRSPQKKHAFVSVRALKCIGKTYSLATAISQGTLPSTVKSPQNMRADVPARTAERSGGRADRSRASAGENPSTIHARNCTGSDGFEKKENSGSSGGSKSCSATANAARLPAGWSVEWRTRDGAIIGVFRAFHFRAWYIKLVSRHSSISADCAPSVPRRPTPRWRSAVSRHRLDESR